MLQELLEVVSCLRRPPKSLAGLDSSNTPAYNAHKRNYAGSKLEEKKKKAFSVMLACRENNSMDKEISSDL